MALNNDNIKKLLANSGNISIGFEEINLVDFENFQNFQIGYSIDFKGQSLIGNDLGDWKKGWVVIAEDSLGDPIFINIDDENYPVFTAQHGKEKWTEIKISDTFENFLNILKDLRELSIDRDNPAKIEENPITETEYHRFISNVKNKNPNTEIGFWEVFLEND